jgi:hypothetical protein
MFKLEALPFEPMPLEPVEEMYLMDLMAFRLAMTMYRPADRPLIR